VDDELRAEAENLLGEVLKRHDAAFEALANRDAGVLDPAQRAAEKQASRDRDQARLDAGEVSAQELSRENDFFSCFDGALEIVEIGGKPFGKRLPRE